MIEVFGLPRPSTLRNCVPVLTMICAAFLDMEFFSPLLGIGLHSEHMVLYTWLIYYPSLIPLSFLVILGILQDCIAGFMLGTSVILLLGFYGLVIYNRHHFNQHPFWLLWLGFAGVEGTIQLLAWLFALLEFPGSTGGLMFIKQTCLTVICYPLIGWLILKLHSKIHVDL